MYIVDTYYLYVYLLTIHNVKIHYLVHPRVLTLINLSATPIGVNKTRLTLRVRDRVPDTTDP